MSTLIIKPSLPGKVVLTITLLTPCMMAFLVKNYRDAILPQIVMFLIAIAVIICKIKSKIIVSDENFTYINLIKHVVIRRKDIRRVTIDLMAGLNIVYKISGSSKLRKLTIGIKIFPREYYELLKSIGSSLASEK